MKDKTFLMIPGPTPVPESVLLAMARHPMGHRSAEFSQILKETNAALKWLFQTKHDVYTFASSGTGAMEAALANLVNPGNKVLSLVIGNFGERWAKIAEMRGARVERLTAEYGCAICPEDLKERLEKDINKEIKIVTLTHNETATGVTNPLKELIHIIKEHGALSVVDGVTSIGAIDCPMDKWGIDVLISGSQKGFMMPPGLGFLAASEKAFKMHEKCEHPSFYFNWTQYKKSMKDDTTPWTPAINLIFALHEALKLMQEEGLENIFNRHKSIAIALREAVKAMGLSLFVQDESIASYAITSILPPCGINVDDIRKYLKKDYQIVVADGQNELKGKIFRMGTLGFVCKRDLIAAVGSLEAVLIKLGHKTQPGAGVNKLLEHLKD